MSGSPKYTSAALAARQAAELAERRRQREREKAQRAEARRLAQEQAERGAMSAALAAVGRRLEALGSKAAAAGLTARQAEIGQEVRACAAAISAASGPSALAAARGRIAGIERALDELGTRAAAVLARRERGQALKATRDALSAVADRAGLDPAGAAECAGLLTAAEAALADQAAFDKAHGALHAGVVRHLATVRERRAQLDRARGLAESATSEAEAVLADITADAAEIEGVDAARGLLERLASQVRDGDAAAIEKLAEQVRGQAARLCAEHAAWADRMDRARVLIEAVTRALPEAGLTLERGSERYQGTSVSVRAQRADGSCLGVAVIPDDGDGAEILYQSDGADTVVERTVDGVTATCDLTEELIEGLHTALASEGVETGELLWEGKPAVRPDRKAGERFWTEETRERGGRR